MKIKSELGALVAIAVVSFIVFTNVLSGDFVYDDNRQVVRNPLIQEASLYGKALVSDVWAFKASGMGAASNYWRPTFVAWMILNFLVFDLKPFGWHLSNILLHSCVCIVAYLLLRRWNASRSIAFAIVLVFAVHPVHTESVAWISGAPDLVFTLTLLGSIWFAERFVNTRNQLDQIWASILYALALGAKEIGIFCFFVFPVIFWKRTNGKDPKAGSKRKVAQPPSRPLVYSLPFPAIGILYFFTRWGVLGVLSQSPEDAVNLKSAILSMPSMFLFYLRQILFPFQLAANYPLRPIQTVDLLHFGLPLIVSIGVLVFAWLAARRSLVQRIGLTLCILPLLPVMNAAAFIPEQIVHDRYLYLPLLGFLMVVAPVVERFIAKSAFSRKENVVPAIAVVVSVPLAVATWNYNRSWTSNFALWSHAVRADENSAFNWSQYAVELGEQGKNTEAIEAYNNSLRIRSSPLALMGQARNFVAIKQYDRATQNLRAVINLPNERVNFYVLYQAYETLAIALVQQEKLDEAENRLREARNRLPMYAAALTEKLAIVLYQANKKADAVHELEAAKEQARKELLLESKSVFWRLGVLYAELGQKKEARSNFEEFLGLTAGIEQKQISQQRHQAEEFMRQTP
jgi:tetratricopeptide (TPR) repeat protein